MKIDVPKKYHIAINDRIYDLTLLVYIIGAGICAWLMWIFMVVVLILGGC